MRIGLLLIKQFFMFTLHMLFYIVMYCVLYYKLGINIFQFMCYVQRNYVIKSAINSYYYLTW